MGDLGILIIIAIIFIIKKAVDAYKLDNYDLTRIDDRKMSMEAGKSPNEIRKNMISGKYNK